MTRTIEADVIPRLMLTHGQVSWRPDEPAQPSPLPIGANDTREFIRLLLDHDVSVAESYVAALRDRGASLESVYLYLFAPCARLLGDLWKEDLCTFADVTVGLSRLQVLLRKLAVDRRDVAREPADAHSILLAAAPGEQHTFGVIMVEESFRRAGWDVCGVGASPVDEIVRLVRRESFDVIGFSMTGGHLSDKVAFAIESIRRASRNRNIRVLLGGRAVADDPDRALTIGADAIATEGRQAALMLSRLIGEAGGAGPRA